MPLCKGENGKAVTIDKDKLSSDNRSKFDTGWKNNEFNEFASDMISLHRSLPDIRHEGFVVQSINQSTFVKRHKSQANRRRVVVVVVVVVSK